LKQQQRLIFSKQQTGHYVLGASSVYMQQRQLADRYDAAYGGSAEILSASFINLASVRQAASGDDAQDAAP